MARKTLSGALPVKLLSNGPEETFRCGFTLGKRLGKGDTVCLFGELGAGKTTFVKGIASALGIPERKITSASFTIIAEYTGTVNKATVPFYHIDLYRLQGIAELDSIGIEEYIGRDGISVIEWAERLGEVEGSISVTFTIVAEDKREITIEGMDETGRNNL
ncbi:MAG: tRNA (adenosine(37)-N6)-threonylcarbamoyltransferase complex ATPase subunit type 1 TsaE [Nitrospirae bacterium]|nr:tRNA (adenosine(37)-N6)-threonylcarbamoyltransferase complex ATPase subunit type 1 TsaE [Nitrospirota bacterium]MCL5420901.1 tRNA (adenosine(37)-N6)-threonylcarbamoyltransferase complex ATPase subunit type 1 TsaE [Nitrospirota bacterium]